MTQDKERKNISANMRKMGKIISKILHIYVVLSLKKYAYNSVSCKAIKLVGKLTIWLNIKMCKGKKCHLSNFQI